MTGDFRSRFSEAIDDWFSAPLQSGAGQPAGRKFRSATQMANPRQTEFRISSSPGVPTVTCRNAVPSRMRAALRCLVGAVVIGGAGAPASPASAQQSPQRPAFRSRIDIVRIDVAVIDNKTGKPLTGLTARDFSVSENGVPQEITTFSAESPNAALDVQGTPKEGGKTAEQQRRVFLFVFGGTQERSEAQRLEGPVDPYSGVIQFIRQRLRPTDLAGVMVLNRVTNLTTDHRLVADVVERLKRPPPDIFFRILGNAQKRMDPSADAQAQLDAWLQPPGAPRGFLRSTSALLIGTAEYRQNDAITQWDRWTHFFDILKVAAGIEYLRHVEGERHLVLLNNFGLTFPVKLTNAGRGMRLDSAEEDQRLAARANDAGVALDIIHTIGTTNFAPSSISSSSVAEHSGGQFTSLRTAERQLARVDEASRSGYNLGYVPKAPTLDGKYRNIHVDVNRRGVTVVYRRGYTARADPPAFDPAELLVSTRLRDAAASDIAVSDIKVQVEARYVPGTDGSRQVHVQLSIDATKLPLKQVGNKWEGRVDLMILCGDSRQNVVGKLDQRMTLSMSQDLYEQARKGGIPYSVAVPVNGPATRVKVIVYNIFSDLLGTATAAVK